MMAPKFFAQIYFIMIPIICGIVTVFFLLIGLRGIITKRPFLVSSRWLLFAMFLAFLPGISMILFPGSISFILKWLNPIIFTVALVAMCFTLQGYTTFGITDTSFREALLAALQKLQLPYEETLSSIRLTSIEADLQVSVQSWVGSGVIKIKQREHRSQLTEIVAAMNEHFRRSSASVNLTTCVIYLVMGILMAALGIAAVFFFQNIIMELL
ncbi:hypothetical protein F4054_20100 [Candidatus Poribacteria bacterium]|nr:hypothetical protein [Candidatus Poribacteria bacterium]MYG06399.1 hypothetical protein [Candidatus Poribacteria bacterium]MYK24549.1 hypothetical protein [Candidatus Poribacteria bacterium]